MIHHLYKRLKNYYDSQHPSTRTTHGQDAKTVRIPRRPIQKPRFQSTTTPTPPPLRTPARSPQQHMTMQAFPTHRKGWDREVRGRRQPEGPSPAPGTSFLTRGWCPMGWERGPEGGLRRLFLLRDVGLKITHHLDKRVKTAGERKFQIRREIKRKSSVLTCSCLRRWRASRCREASSRAGQAMVVDRQPSSR